MIIKVIIKFLCEKIQYFFCCKKENTIIERKTCRDFLLDNAEENSFSSSTEDLDYNNIYVDHVKLDSF